MPETVTASESHAALAAEIADLREKLRNAKDTMVYLVRCACSSAHLPDDVLVWGFSTPCDSIDSPLGIRHGIRAVDPDAFTKKDAQG